MKDLGFKDSDCSWSKRSVIALFSIPFFIYSLTLLQFSVTQHVDEIKRLN